MSKITVHALNHGSDAARAFVAATKPGFAVCVNSFWTELQSLVPGLRVIGRIFNEFDANAVARSGVLPRDAARAYVEGEGNIYRLNPAVTIWQGPKEPVFGPADDPANVVAFMWYAQFEAERVRLLAQMGLLACTGNFGMGLPDLTLWNYWGPVWEAHRRYGGWTVVDEYQDPTATLVDRALNRLRPPQIIQKETYRLVSYADMRPTAKTKYAPGWPQSWGSENDWSWLFLRVKRAYDVAVSLGYPDARFGVAECGTATGWLDLGLSAEDYAAWLARYDGELRKLPFVDFAAVFTSGDSWGGFLVDNHSVLSTLAGLVPVGSQVSPPIPPPPVGETFPYRVRVTTGACWLRDGPGMTAEHDGVTFYGQQFEVVGREGSWLKLEPVWVHDSCVAKV